MRALNLPATWPVDTVAVGVATADGPVATSGDVQHRFRLASVTKLLTALAVLVAVEEGTVQLDGPAGPSGSSVRHLLAHASGLPFEGDEPLATPGSRRIYSNRGFEVLAEHVEAASGIPFDAYLQEAVLDPLGLDGTGLDGTGLETGSPAAGASGPLADVLALGGELLAPTLVSPETLAEATSVEFPGLVGLLPGFGHQAPCDWGLGFELKDAKAPHWTGSANSPQTFGHFGGTGTFLWVDPAVGLACAALADRDFGPWAAEVWPVFSDAVLAEYAPGT